MDLVHGSGPYFDGPGPWTGSTEGSMDQGSMFCTLPPIPITEKNSDWVIVVIDSFRCRSF